MRDFEAVRIIETLRSGVSSRHLSAIFSYGREALLETVQRDLDRIRAEKDSEAVILRGDYGEGKTHFLNAVFNLAQEQNFAVSFVVLSKETPFNRLDRVYPKVACETYLPGASEPGVETLLRDLRPASPVAEELLEFAREELHPKIACLLENYLRAPEPYDLHLLYRDLVGEWLRLDELKSMTKKTSGRPVRIEKFSPRLHVWDYFRFLAHLIRVRGLAGWVILFDEFELVGTLGIAARGEAYYSLHRFLFPESDKKLEATYIIFGIASEFWPMRLVADRRPDIEEVPARLLAKGEQQKAEAVRRTLKALLHHTVELQRLSEADIRQMLKALRDRHAQAYGWQPEVDLDEILNATRHTRLRTKIRYALEYLDLKYLYREEPAVETKALKEMSLDEAAAVKAGGFLGD